MRQLLEQNNRDLINELEKIEFSLHQKEAFLLSELNDYYNWLLGNCTKLKYQIKENLVDLSKNQDSILVDILSNTNVATRSLHELNRFFLNPILRMSVSDQLCVKLLDWLHKNHSKTTNQLFAISDGSFASLPYPQMPTIYFIPPSSQERLLYLPLLFHEFGHLLYAFHKDEMDCLVEELQQQIVQALEPNVYRNDDYSLEENKWRKIITEIWYEWTQEVFCDAVGLTIGGPAYLNSFSMHLRMLGREEFQIPKNSLVLREHPVTWIRIKILANRAKNMSLEKNALELETSWLKIASYLEITEDYFGFYTQDFLTIIQQKIDDMLIEADPNLYKKSEIEEYQEDIGNMSPIKLFNLAWDKFYSDQNSYNSWENKAIGQWLKN